MSCGGNPQKCAKQQRRGGDTLHGELECPPHTRAQRPGKEGRPRQRRVSLRVRHRSLKPSTKERTEANVHVQFTISRTAHSSSPLISLRASDFTAPWKTAAMRQKYSQKYSHTLLLAQEHVWIICLTAAVRPGQTLKQTIPHDSPGETGTGQPQNQPFDLNLFLLSELT